ncbi:MAG: hypothetical protein HYX50_00580 [Chloroflexi bacterium]|nr:hypothetical protein [Chloroflexota bacterium]
MALVAFVAAACSGRVSGPTPVPPTLRVTNQTPCILHIRFDNGPPIGRAAPGVTTEFTDAGLPTYEYLKAESTQAIFRTYPMDPIRAANYALTIIPAIDDKPCVEQ